MGRWPLAIVAAAIVVLSFSGAVSAADSEAPTSPDLFNFTSWHPMLVWWIAPIGSLAALLAAWVFYKQVKRSDPGDQRMQEIASYVREGAFAYLRRQYKVVAIFFVVVSAILFLLGWVLHVQHRIVFLAFLTGGFFSGLCGFFGMSTATLASNRTTQAAKESLDRGLRVAFRAGSVMGLVVVGFGLLDISLWFLALTQLAPRLGYNMSLVEVSVVMLTFGMGASSQALFARLGGGIFTKAADVGADLVGKIEAGIPEDDPRNPATIADNVGDNVGDVAGMGADLYESYCGSILSTAVLGVASATALVSTGVIPAARLVDAQIRLLSAPMVLAGIGIVLSVLGILIVRTRENATMKQLMGALMRGINFSTVLIVAAAFFVCWLLLADIPGVWWIGVWLATVVGLVAGVVIGKGTEYFTSYDYRPTREIARQADTGPATVIIAGIAEGMQSTWLAMVTVIVSILLAFAFAGGFREVQLGLYGISIAAVGMLATLGITLATDAYGPIADNAGGNAEMTHQPPEVRKRTDALDSLGNTTAATGKGFAIGSAALTALALLAAYIDEVRVGLTREAQTVVVAHDATAATNAQAGLGQLYYGGYHKFAMKFDADTDESSYTTFMALTRLPEGLKAGPVQVPASAAAGSLGPLGPPDADNVRRFTLAAPNGKDVEVQVVSSQMASLAQYMLFYNVTLMNPKVICGIIGGVLMVFLFCAAAMKAVGRNANRMVLEVRRQFKEIPGIMQGTAKPDYARCVTISTAGAQREMVLPSLMALIVPILIGLVLDVGGVMGLLAGGMACGFAVAVYMANAGGAWDNAKKFIESGHMGGKGSAPHKAAVVGDTVGDPFKDTAGPCLNILIKLMSMVSVVFAGLIVKYAPIIGDLIGLK